jgi:hypothetical protein
MRSKSRVARRPPGVAEEAGAEVTARNRRDCPPRPSGRQALAPLPATLRQHAPAALGLHSRAKPVLLMATAYVGLEGAFRHLFLGKSRADAGALRAKVNSKYRGAGKSASRRACPCDSIAWKTPESCGIVRNFPGNAVGSWGVFFPVFLSAGCRFAHSYFWWVLCITMKSPGALTQSAA